MAKTKKPREIISFTHEKESNPLDLTKFQRYMNEGRLSGYIQRDGQYSDGKSFAQVMIIIDVPANYKAEK